MFDSVILLTKGEVAYFGPSKDILDHFGKLGYECPNDTNPADYLCKYFLTTLLLYFQLTVL